MATDMRPAAPYGRVSTAASKLMFPPLHHADDPRFHNPILQHPLLESEQLPIPTLDGEVVQVPEHLLPPTEDLDSDTLPIEQHPSYPFGNPFFIHHAPSTLQPAGSSQPKLDPRMHSKLAMHAAHDSAREDVLMRVATGSASARAAIEDKKNDAEADEEAQGGVPSYTLHPDGSAHLAPHLQMRAQVVSTPKPPTWPFTRFGPGPSARPYASLFRSASPHEASAEVSIWADFALEQLVPRPRPDSYTLPSSLKHPYAHPERRSPRRSGRRARPSDIPPALGAETAEIDHLWLDGADSEYAASRDDFEDGAASWTSSAMATLSADMDAIAELERSARDARRGPRSRHVSSAWMQDRHDFCQTLRTVCARKEHSALLKRRHEHAASPADFVEARKKHRFDALERPSGEDPNGWVWGVSRALDRPA
ncbi:hypothetical protein GLX27_003946 [Malassezia furfur]|uniref:Uncharacterized protein n=1 Tax=Malassezia furfur TaxID=55194 RepID=A0ABY8EV30_MALFU|nr:hypothetical protein GLX27_003946 [Malassezia furfur]